MNGAPFALKFIVVGGGIAGEHMWDLLYYLKSYFSKASQPPLLSRGLATVSWFWKSEIRGLWFVSVLYEFVLFITLDHSEFWQSRWWYSVGFL
jgi:hypothetical protein